MVFLNDVTLALVIPIGLALARPTVHLPREMTNTSKAGLAWPNGNSVDIEQFRGTGKVSWYYSWSPYSIDADLEYIPMLWGQKSVDQFTSTINETIARHGVKAVLGMNEPQQTGQSNLTPADGATMWKTYLEPLRAQGIRLGSPAPSSAPSGKIWLQDFFTACDGGCTVDFIALHWYDVNATRFIEYVEDFYNTFQRPLWVTEWACQNYNDVDKQCSQDDIVLFLDKTQSFMDNAAYVERYSWFGAMTDMQGVNPGDALMDREGKINALGKQYIGAAPAQTSGSGNADGPNAPGGGGVPISGAIPTTLHPRSTISALFLLSSTLLAVHLL
ncbi:glycosyl hydrolase catalytic core-domain-containing protein [Lyophyllum atratum]|nr:glycosyl hydrolase catalytic core-domain-containing protein [Lyophyllum atratum]